MGRKPAALNHGEGKEALLAATVRVVARKGLRGLTFRAVADEAGVNNTLIAHHFGSRQNLLAATFAWTADRSLAAADLAEYATDAAAFRAEMVRNVLAQPEVELFQFEMILESTRTPALQPAVRQLYRRYVGAVAAGRSELGIPTTDALNLAVFAALDGLMLQFLSHSITAGQLADAVDALGDVVSAASLSQRSR